MEIRMARRRGFHYQDVLAIMLAFAGGLLLGVNYPFLKGWACP